MGKSEPIPNSDSDDLQQTPNNTNDEENDHSQSLPLENLDDLNPNPVCQEALTKELNERLNLKDVDHGDVNGVLEEAEVVLVVGKEEEVKEGVAENKIGKLGEVVKDGWSDYGGGGGGGGGEVVDYGNGIGYDVGSWENGNGAVEFEEGEEERSMQVQYPLRPGAEDCSFYMRTGSCKFGSSCKFNHPLERSDQMAKPRMMRKREDGFERPMQAECKYYLTAGGCKYGNACRFNHSRARTPVLPVAEYNFLGLPIRPGEKECPFYMRNGSCKYAANCRFNHPDPTAGSDSHSGYGNDEQAAPWSSSRPLDEAIPFVPVTYSSVQVVNSHNVEWNGYPGPAYDSEKSFHPFQAFISSIPPVGESSYSHFQPQLASEDFPERPGQPECSFFMKTGDCKFKSGCKFHHPKDRNVQPPCVMTDKGLPLRPGQSVCTHYSRYGICKFGPKCRYDHPPNIHNVALPPMTGLDQQHNPFNNFESAQENSRLNGIGDGTNTL